MAERTGGRPPGRYALVDELNAEWARIVARHRDGPPWSGELAGHGDLGQLIGAIRDRPDPILGALIRESATGDGLAARTVLQAMLGKAVLLSRSLPEAEPADVLGALWCRIRTYPLARRPTRIAANLALDTRKDVVRQLRADRLGRLSADRLWVTAPGPDPADLAPAEARQLIVAAERRGILDPITATVLRAVYLDGDSGRVAAARLGTSAGMIRYRCSRGVRALTRHASELGHETFGAAA